MNSLYVTLLFILLFWLWVGAEIRAHHWKKTSHQWRRLCSDACNELKETSAMMNKLQDLATKGRELAEDVLRKHGRL